jgi:hypothetical protein
MEKESTFRLGYLHAGMFMSMRRLKVYDESIQKLFDAPLHMF